MDRIINVKVAGNYLTKDNKNAGTRGEANATILRITFDEGWDKYAKSVLFWDAHGLNPTRRTLTLDLLESNEEGLEIYRLPIPGVALGVAGEMTFEIEGYFDGEKKRQKSIPDTLEVKDGLVVDSVNDPTPSEAENLQGQIQWIKATIDDALKSQTEAGISKNEAATSAGAAATSAGAAATSAGAAATSAGDAEEQARFAAGSATAASESAAFAEEMGDKAESFANKAEEAAKKAEKSASVQADYNQNDDTKPDYIKNKPISVTFSEDINETFTINYTEGEPNPSSEDKTLGLVAGNDYKILFKMYEGEDVAYEEEINVTAEYGLFETINFMADISNKTLNIFYIEIEDTTLAAMATGKSIGVGWVSVWLEDDTIPFDKIEVTITGKGKHPTVDYLPSYFIEDGAICAWHLATGAKFEIAEYLKKKGIFATSEDVDKEMQDAEEKVDNKIAELKIKNKASGSLFTLPDSAEQPFKSMKVFGKTKQVSTTGKNLLPYPYIYNNIYGASHTVRGVTFTTNDDGSITISGTNNGEAISQVQLAKTMEFSVGRTYVLSPGSANTSVSARIQYIKPGVSGYSYASTYTHAEGNIINQIFLDVATGATVNETIYPIIVEGNTYDGVWEPYKSQFLTISTPNGFLGVPVSSGGNYTDENGQQYISDYKDYERKVYVQRVGKWIYTGGDVQINTCMVYQNSNVIYWNVKVNGVKAPNSFSSPVLSNVFLTGKSVYNNSGYIMAAASIANYLYMSLKASDFGFASGDGRGAEYKPAITNWMQTTFSEDNPLIALYELETPIETPLSEEEIAAYKALHTNYPVTTIYNNDGAGTEVEYVADTKNYIDNKIATEVAKLTAAIITE